MENLYLIVFQSENDLKKITDLFDSHNLGFWFYNLPHSVFLKSKKNAKEIFDVLDPLELKNFVITKVNKKVGIDYFGRLPKEHWKHFE